MKPALGEEPSGVSRPREVRLRSGCGGLLQGLNPVSLVRAGLLTMPFLLLTGGKEAPHWKRYCHHRVPGRRGVLSRL